MARVCAAESNSLAWRRKCVRHSVTDTVNTMYSTNATKVMTAKPRSNLTDKMPSTSTISIRVGTTLYSE